MADVKNRVVITGIGPVSPIGIGKDDFWVGLKAGKNGVMPLRDFQGLRHISGLRPHSVGAIRTLPDSEPSAGYTRYGTIAKMAVELALKDGGLEGTQEGGDIAFILGTAVGETKAMEDCFLRMDVPGIGLSQELAPPGLLEKISFNSLTNVLANRYGFRGTRLTVSTGCTASLDAIGIAYERVRAGQNNMVIAGGVEAPITPVVLAAFDALGALSVRECDASESSCPFDQARDGFVLGEGGAFMVVENYESARLRGAHVYAEITGFASRNNCYHMTDLPADGASLVKCMNECITNSGIPLDEFDLVSAHGSSTPQNDICETNAIKEVFGRHAGSLYVNSLKSMLGHALGASNALEIAACALGIKNGFVSPTINLKTPGKGCDLNYVPNKGVSANVRNIIKLSSGFSGIHSVITIGKVSDG